MRSWRESSRVESRRLLSHTPHSPRPVCVGAKPHSAMRMCLNTFFASSSTFSFINYRRFSPRLQWLYSSRAPSSSAASRRQPAIQRRPSDRQPASQPLDHHRQQQNGKKNIMIAVLITRRINNNTHSPPQSSSTYIRDDLLIPPHVLLHVVVVLVAQLYSRSCPMND